MQTSWNVYCRRIEMLQNSQFVLKCCTFCTYFFMRPSNPGPTWGTWLTLVLINWSNFWASSSRALESTWWLTQSDQPFWHKIQNVYCRTINVSRVTPSHLINTPPIKKRRRSALSFSFHPGQIANSIPKSGKHWSFTRYPHWHQNKQFKYVRTW